MENNSQVNLQQFKISLQNFLKCTSSEELKLVEKNLEDFTKNPQAILEITNILAVETLPLPLTQLLAVLLKKSIIENFNKLTQENQEKLYQNLWSIFYKFQNQTKIIEQISTSIALIYQALDKNMNCCPEVQTFISENLQFQDKEKFISSVVFLCNVIDNCILFFDLQQVCAIVNKIVEIFQYTYQESLDEIFYWALKVLNMFSVFFLETNQEETMVQDYIKKVLEIQHSLLLNQSFVDSKRMELEELFVIFFDFLAQNVEFQNSSLNLKTIEMITDFLLQSSILLNAHLDDSIKISALDLHREICFNYTSMFSQKNTNGLFNKFLNVYFQLINQEEEKMHQIVQDEPERKLMLFNRDNLQNIAFSAIEHFSQEQKSKKLYTILKTQIYNYLKNNQPKLALKLLSSIAEHYPIYICQELDEYVEKIINPQLNTTDEVTIFYTLQCICYFSEFLAPEITEYHQDFLDHSIKIISQIQHITQQNCKSYQSIVTLKLIDLSLSIVELTVENLSQEELSPYSEQLYQLVISIMNSQVIDSKIKRNSISTLSSVLSSFPQQFLLQNLLNLMQHLSPFLQQEDLQGETLICLGRLCLYSLKDYTQKQEIYVQFFEPIYRQCQQIYSNLDTLIDYEIYEGALTFIYQSIELFGRDGQNFIEIGVIDKWLQYLLDLSSREINLENEDEEQQIKAQKLSFYYMTSAAIHFIGVSLRYFPMEIMQNNDRLNQFKSLFDLGLEFEYEDQRHQSYIGISNLVLGQLQYMNVNSSCDMIKAIVNIFNSETQTCNLKRNLDVLSEFFKDCQKLNLHSFIQDQNFLSEFIGFIKSTLIKTYQKDQDPDFYIELSEMMLSYYQILEPIGVVQLFKETYEIYKEPLNWENADSIYFEEFFGSIAEIIEKNPIILDTIHSEFNQNNQFYLNLQLTFEYGDERLARNGVFLSGVIFQNYQQIDSQIITKILQNIISIYQEAEMPELKDNCVSSLIKLYMNQNGQQILLKFISEQNLLQEIEKIVPLKGDDLESPHFLKVILHLMQKYSQQIISSKNIVLFMFSSIIKKKEWKIEESLIISLKEVILRFKDQGCFGTVYSSLTQGDKQLVDVLLN